MRYEVKLLCQTDLKNGLGMQSFRDAVHHLSLRRERLRVREG